MMVGQTIAHYKILEKLGEGGMGIVYKAEDIVLKRPAALKFLPPDLVNDPAAKERFILEAQAASALNHAHISTIYGIEESPAGTFIAMEYVEGKTLKEILSAGTGRDLPLPINQILDLAIQVCEGLAAAHEKGIVHRDIKADNIMITSRGQAKVMDFGLAKLKGAGKLTQSRSTLGTLSYMSPEQARGEEVDRRSDIFSLGVVLYEMLAGRLPFAGEFQAAVIYAIINEAQQPVARYNSHVSAELERIVGKALAKDREERYQHADDLLADLRRERKGLEYVKEGQVSKVVAVPKAKKKWWPFAAAAVAVAAIAVLLLLFSPFKLRIGPRQPIQAAVNSLAVMYFENLQDPEDKNKTAQMITALLTTGLSDSPRYMQVVSSQRLFDIMKLLGKADLKIIDKTVASEVARKANVQWMLTGKVLREQPNIVLVSEISEAGSGKILATQQVHGAAGEDLFSAVDKLGSQVVRGLNLPVQARKDLEKPVAALTTRSQDAYRHYIEGIEFFYKGYYNEAEKSLGKTIRIDPSFARAYFRLAMIKFLNDERRAAKENIREMLKHATAMTRKENLYVESLAAAVAGDFDKGIKKLREITEFFPDEKEAFLTIALLTFRQLFNPGEAIPYLEKAIAIDPLYKYAYNLLAYCCYETGDRERSSWAIQQYIALAPDEANPYDSQGDLYAYDGQVDAAIASYKKALAIKPDFFISLNKIGYMYMFKQEYSKAEECFKSLTHFEDPYARAIGRLSLPGIPMVQGKFAKALKALNDFIDTARVEQDYPLEEVYHRISKAMVLWAQGDLRSAIEEIETTSKVLKKAEPDFTMVYQDNLAYLLSRSKRMAEAQAIVDTLKKLSETRRQFIFIYWRAAGAVALAKNDLQEARSCFEKGDTDSFLGIYLLASTYLQTGEADKAAARLEKALSRFNWAIFLEPILAVKAHYLLGLAYERSGRREKAIRKYEEFLDIWKDADAGLLEVADARQRLEQLKKQ